jgi:hypothetical protein
LDTGQSNCDDVGRELQVVLGLDVPDPLTFGEDRAMGDKGGKKDKDKSKKQKAMKQQQATKGKQDQNRPK